MTARRPRTLITVLAAAGALAAGSAALPWATITGRSILGTDISTSLNASALAPVAMPAALIVLAASAALALAGRTAASVICVVAIIASGVMVIAGLSAIGAAPARAETAAGLVGVTQVDVVPTLAPIALVAFAAAALAAASVVLMRRGRWLWTGRLRTAGTGDVDEWDVLSRGQDPTA